MRVAWKKQYFSTNGYLLWTLIAIELFMSFSFLGYIHIEPVSLTFVYIPVLVAGCVLGIKEATLVGIIFGLASMWKASAFYVGKVDAIFSPTLSGAPIQSLLLSVGARALFGFLSGLFYYWAKKGKHPIAGIIIVSSLGRSLHSFLVYGAMQLLFPQVGLGISHTLDGMLEWDFFLVAVIIDIIVLSCYMLFRSDHVKRFWQHIESVDQMRFSPMHSRKKLLFLAVLMGGSSFCVAAYFTDRIKRIISQYGYELSYHISHDLLHVQFQFLFGIWSLSILMIIIIIVYQKNFNYLYYEARLDGLTGLLGRKQFFQEGRAILENAAPDKKDKNRYFIILDVDYFKSINDKYGHPVGDAILKDVANELKKVFGGKSILGRLGGDEFVVLVHSPLSDKELKELLQSLREGIAKIKVQDEAVACSFGAIPVEKGASIETVYHSADLLLYEEKKRKKELPS